jgi:hypothetical protein
MAQERVIWPTSGQSWQNWECGCPTLVISVVWVSKIQRKKSGAPTSKRERLRRPKTWPVFPYAEFCGSCEGALAEKLVRFSKQAQNRNGGRVVLKCLHFKLFQRRSKKKSCIRSETEGIKITIKSQELSPKRGARDGTRTHVGMSKRSDLHNKGQESTSHQAALATGRTNLIYTIHQTIRQTRARRWSSYKMSYRNGQLCP